MNTTKVKTGGADYTKGELFGGWAEYECETCHQTVRTEAETFQKAKAVLCTHDFIGHVVRDHLSAAQQKKCYPAVKKAFLNA